MAESQGAERRDAAAESKLLTLSEVSQKTNISMPTLQRYKKTYQDRIPSVGSGRKQRYPEHALPVFEELRSENAGKRGRPRKNAAEVAAPVKRDGRDGRDGRGARRAAAGRRGAGAAAKTAAGRAGSRRAPAAAARRGAAAGRRAAGRPAAATANRRSAGARGARAGSGRGKGSGLLTLTQISKTTGISYPTLVRYVHLYADRLPHEGEGRARRFHPEAVAVFRSLREASGRGGRRAGQTAARRGRPPKAESSSRLEGILAARIRDLEKFQQAIEKRFGKLVKGLQKLR